MGVHSPSMDTTKYRTTDRAAGLRFSRRLADLGYSVDFEKDREAAGWYSATVSSATLPEPVDVLVEFPSMKEA